MGKGQTIAGFVLGVVSLTFLMLGGYVMAFFCLPSAVVGLILSVMGRKKLRALGAPTGLATAGLIIGIISVSLSAITFLTCTMCFMVGWELFESGSYYDPYYYDPYYYDSYSGYGFEYTIASML